jgi:ribosomal protein L11 methyltransferase
VSWLEATFAVDAALADAVADALLERGALSVDTSDADADTEREQPLFGEPGACAPAGWPRQRMRVLFPQGIDVAGVVGAAFDSVGLRAPLQARIGQVAEQDWVRATQQQFAPVQVGERLWIVPSWRTPPDPAAVNLMLDPGLAFGTGTHPTTQQCLAWLEANLRPGASVLDYGCGSGVLAIAAKRLGAGEVVAVDIDPAALAAARSNAAINAADIAVVATDAVPAGPYAVILANILASPLVLLAPVLAAFSAGGAHLVLAGILAGQAAGVAAAYAPWFDVETSSEIEGWTCLAGIRKG